MGYQSVDRSKRQVKGDARDAIARRGRTALHQRGNLRRQRRDTRSSASRKIQAWLACSAAKFFGRVPGPAHEDAIVKRRARLVLSVLRCRETIRRPTRDSRGGWMFAASLKVMTVRTGPAQV